MTRLTLGILAAAALGAAGCGPKAEKAAVAEKTPRAVPVTVVQAQARAVERTVPLVGTLKGWEEVTVGSKKPGRVVRVLHDMGDRVQPGEPLVELDPVDARLAILQAETRYLGELVKLGITREKAEQMEGKFGVSEKILRGDEANRLIEATPAIQQAKAALDKAQQNLSRQRAVYQRGAGVLQDLQNLEIDFHSAQAAYDNGVLTARSTIASAMASKVALDVAKQALADMTIRAPQLTALPKGLGSPGSIRYAITKRTVSEGQMLREGDAVFDLVIENPLRLWSNVPERFSSIVQVDQPVRLSVTSHPEESFLGSVSRINPAVDPVSRTFQVEAVVSNSNGELHPGGFAKASILTRRDDRATVVPQESVVRFAGVTKVFVVDDKAGVPTAQAVEVRTGQEEAGWVEVIGKIDDRARVVTSGQSQLADGTKVLIREPELKTAQAKSAAL